MLPYYSAAFAALFITFVIYPRFSRGLNKFNGPILASFSNFWRLWYAITGAQKQLYVDVHRRYGDIVRVGPNELSFADPTAIRDIYGPSGTQQKSDVYNIPATPMNGKVLELLFTGTDMAWHDRQRRLVNNAFATSTLIKYEPWINDIIRAFCNQIDATFATTGAPMDMMQWFTFFSMDAICNITFGEPAGFIAAGEDINDGMLSKAQHFTESWLFWAKVPWADRLLFKNPVLMWLNRKGWYQPFNPFLPLFQRQFSERQQFWEDTKGRPSDREMILDMFLRIQKEHPEVPDFQPIMHSLSVVGGASESIAIQTSSIFYSLMRNRRCYQKLQAELDTLMLAEDTPVPFSIANDLPYLNAVINEAMRMWWVNRLPVPRLTPPAGMTICGTYIPGGVEVGVYGPVVHRSKAVFGEDVDDFRPERWLGPEEKVRVMQNTLFTFGHGRYACAGKNLARMELLKLVPSLVRRFEFSMPQPEKEWTLANGAFMAPVGFEALVKAR